MTTIVIDAEWAGSFVAYMEKCVMAQPTSGLQRKTERGQFKVEKSPT